MKTKIEVTNETAQAIQTYIDLCEKFKNAYFFKPPMHASSRRKMEEDNNFHYDKDGIKLDFSLSVSSDILSFPFIMSNPADRPVPGGRTS